MLLIFSYDFVFFDSAKMEEKELQVVFSWLERSQEGEELGKSGKASFEIWLKASAEVARHDLLETKSPFNHPGRKGAQSSVKVIPDNDLICFNFFAASFFYSTSRYVFYDSKQR